MKKLLALLLALAMVLALAACGGPEPDPTTQPTDAPTTKPTDAPTTQPTEAPTTAPTEPATEPSEGPGDGGSGGEPAVQELPEVPTGEGVVAGIQNVVIIGEEWGPAVVKTVVTLEETVSAASVAAESFVVYEVKEAVDMAASSGGEPSEEPVTSMATRTVTAAYTCDEQGNPVEGDSNMIALELAYNANEGSPFLFNIMTMMNKICSPYELHLYVAEGAGLTTADGTAITGLNVVPGMDLQNAMYPQLEGVDLSGVFTGTDGKTLTYSSYAPADDGEKHPLVIWLHGMGEGGTDPKLVILGNEVTALYSEEFQTVMGGAYVLTPQCPGFWMQYTEEGAWEDNPGTSSVFHNTVFELIQDYVANNPNIDTNRIYVGGCSNGGYMTMDLILNHPDYFAAAFPICEAYLDSGITDDKINGIKDLPVWFVYALNDTTVSPDNYEKPTIARLQAIDADVHVSEYENVYGETYMGHWSWLYFFNNECVAEDGTTMWQWLSQQSK